MTLTLSLPDESRTQALAERLAAVLLPELLPTPTPDSTPATTAATCARLHLQGELGSGKTTFARAFLPQEAQCPRFINADLIAAGLSPFAPQLAAIKAGRIMLQEMHECTRQRISFAFETTLAGLTYLRHIRQWRVAGYQVILYFLSLPDAQAAIARVAERVKQGGHAVDAAVIRRRFVAGLRNLEQYKAIVDIWEHYDGSQNPPILLQHGETP